MNKSVKALQLLSATYENAPSTSASRLLPEYRSGLGEQVHRRGLSRAWQWQCRLLHKHVPKPTCGLQSFQRPESSGCWSVSLDWISCSHNYRSYLIHLVRTFLVSPHTQWNVQPTTKYSSKNKLTVTWLIPTTIRVRLYIENAICINLRQWKTLQ